LGFVRSEETVRSTLGGVGYDSVCAADCATGVAGAPDVAWLGALLVGPDRRRKPEIPHAQIQDDARRYPGRGDASTGRSGKAPDADWWFSAPTSLDELPQLWSILKGDMSFVGPRPALFNQDDLVALRTERGVHRLVPGLTGWAQVNGRDELPIPVKVEFDAEYLRRQSFWFDLRILFLTVAKVLKASGVSH
jgi:hypothetical protein